MTEHYGDYIIYVDESGDANLDTPNPSYPMFVLAFCIFRKAIYAASVSPSIQNLKFKHFGHDAVVLHEREIRQQAPPFLFLKSIPKREIFMDDLNGLIASADMKVIAASIHKQVLKDRYKYPENPYHLALKFCMERIARFLAHRKQTERTTHIIFEKRGKEEDRELELEFLRIKDGPNFSSTRMEGMKIVFADKKANSGGLQLADLIARPIGIKHLRHDQPNRAFDIIKEKFHRNGRGGFEGYGLKQFP
ncbi:MAG: DUF3800 domain-containing protein [Deltaproteobacteria bacterium HGW-Deltaproteobacteria-11]|jgi:hypothetical protein|nr:MAG: DUF3800 domain-containing protein [Deltaproteobacteria bacterium HGW-Deltaproteobacteria-11]